VSGFGALDPREIVLTLERLRARIVERLPDARLADVVSAILAAALQAEQRAAAIARPILWLRLAAVLLAAGILVPVGLQVASHRADLADVPLSEYLQTFEASLSALVFLGALILFLMTAESRVRRARALRAIHELRSLAHVVDMHQLTKDPDRVGEQRADTPSSPRLELDRGQLARYLDYCSEALSLTSKVAVLYAQRARDPVVLDAVQDVEDLTGRLSSKIWQKITILDRRE
jgi:hypothetical protein